MIINVLIAIVLLVAPHAADAACSWSGNTGTAANLTTTEISACVTDASSKTGAVTINLPAGSITSTGTVAINMSTGFANVTGLSIIGAGTAPSVGSAESSVLNRGSSTAIVFNVTGSSAKKIRISNIKFTGGRGYDALVTIGGSSKYSAGGGFRVDHCTFGDLTNPNVMRGIRIAGYTYGVIDHNNGINRYQFALVTEGVYGNPSWNRPISIGTADAVFFEDNTIENVDAYKEWMFCDAYDGGRIVIRKNTIYSMYIGQHDASSNGRGVVQVEAYDNTMELRNGMGSADPMMFLRGGTYMVYNNTMTTSNNSGVWGAPIYLRNYRSLATFGCVPPWCDRCDTTIVKICAGTLVRPQICTSDSQCGGESGACVNIDGNEVGTNNGYPCRDQIGIAPTLSGQQTHYPSLFWANTYRGSYVSPTVPADNLNDDHIQNNRDYCHHATTRPASCGGIATVYETGYAYPHPLTGSSSDTTAPEFTSTSSTPLVCSDDPRTAYMTGTTPEPATCKYNSTDTDYDSMTGLFDSAVGQSHSEALLLSCDTSSTYYVRCMDAAGNKATTSTTVTIAVQAGETDTTAPTLSNGSPSGILPCTADPGVKLLSLTCVDNVACTAVKCHASDVDIDSMSITLTQNGTTWSGNTPSIDCDASHTYYCKAEDAADNETAATTIQFDISATAATVTEAESGTLVLPVATIADSGASGNSAIRTTTEYQGTATYTYDIATAGYYQLIGRFYSLGGGSDSWTFAIDGGAANTWHVGGVYNVWTEKTYGTNILFSSTGNKSVVFTGREMDCRFDWFYFNLLSCAAGQRQYCISESACTNVGGIWSSGVCTEPPEAPVSYGVMKRQATNGDAIYKSGGLKILSTN
jgi:hypothetical protein